MKIWPFDPYAEASGGHDISTADLERALEPFRKIRAAVGIADGRHGRAARALGRAGGVSHRPRARAVRPRSGSRIPSASQARTALAEVQAQTGVPLAAGETLAGLAGFRDMLAEGGARVAIVDIGWVGGLGMARKVAALAEAYERPVAPHDCTGPVVYTAATHLSMHAPNAIVQEHVRAFASGWYRELVTELPVVEDGHDHDRRAARASARRCGPRCWSARTSRSARAAMQDAHDRVTDTRGVDDAHSSRQARRSV